MYDFEGEREHGTAQQGGPSRLLTALELPRGIGEYATSRVLDALRSPTDEGAGRPVLLLPGFMSDDRATGRLRSHLSRRGYRPHGWAQGRNIGLVDPLIDGLAARFQDLTERYEQPVSLVGWSFGGVWSRWLAHQYPHATRQVICLASPWRADGEHTRATAMFERSRRKHGLSDRAHAIVDEMRQPLPVPCTAIWSKSDGMVPWRGCRVDETEQPPVAENIEVVSSHVGMGANPLVLAAVADRLAQEPASWEPFDWHTCLTRLRRPEPVG